MSVFQFKEEAQTLIVKEFVTRNYPRVMFQPELPSDLSNWEVHYEVTDFINQRKYRAFIKQVPTDYLPEIHCFLEKTRI